MHATRAIGGVGVHHSLPSARAIILALLVAILILGLSAAAVWAGPAKLAQLPGAMAGDFQEYVLGQNPDIQTTFVRYIEFRSDGAAVFHVDGSGPGVDKTVTFTTEAMQIRQVLGWTAEDQFQGDAFYPYHGENASTVFGHGLRIKYLGDEMVSLYKTDSSGITKVLWPRQ